MIEQYTIYWQLMTIREFWNSINFLNFKESLVIAPLSSIRDHHYEALRTTIDMLLPPLLQTMKNDKSTIYSALNSYWHIQ